MDGDSEDTLPKGWGYDAWYGGVATDPKRCTCGWAKTEYGNSLEPWQHSDWCDLYIEKKKETT
jgi:hypothetical protein